MNLLLRNIHMSYKQQLLEFTLCVNVLRLFNEFVPTRFVFRLYYSLQFIFTIATGHNQNEDQTIIAHINLCFSYNIRTQW